MSESTAGPVAGYETTFITKGEMPDPALAALNEKVAGIVTSFKGEVVQVDDWGKRKLAYPIHKETRGRYSYVCFTGAPGCVAEIERNLRINENVIRFLTVKLDGAFDKEAYLKTFQPFSTEKAIEKSFREKREYDRYDRGDRGDRY